MAARTGDASYDQLHHFVSCGVCDTAPFEAALLTEAEAQVGGDSHPFQADIDAFTSEVHSSLETICYGGETG